VYTKTQQATTASFVGTWELESFTETCSVGVPWSRWARILKGSFCIPKMESSPLNSPDLVAIRMTPPLRSLGLSMELASSLLPTSDTVEALP
jgi:hypothetical protein